MAKVKLTAERVSSFKTDKAQAFLWDSTAPGLAVRATANGSKAYIFQSQIQGHGLRMTIGDVRTWTIPQAQQEARRLQTLIDQGHDPRVEAANRKKSARLELQEAARLKKAAAQQGIPALEVWDEYVKARSPKWGERNLLDHQNMVSPGGAPRTRGRHPGEPNVTQPGRLYRLLQTPLAKLDKETIEAWMKEQSKHGTGQGGLARRLLQGFLNWCATQDEYKDQTRELAFVFSSVAKDTMPRPKARQDVLFREHLNAWFSAVQQIPNPVISTFLQVLLLTGARRGELAKLQWDDVEFRNNTMTIGDKATSYGGEEGKRIIPLTPYVRHLLEALPRRAKWVFASPTAKAGYIAEPKTAHLSALQRAGLPHLTLHGLRRSFGSLAEWLELPVGVVAQIQGHKPSALAEKHYRVRPIDLLRVHHDKLESWILAEAGVSFNPASAPRALRVVNAEG